MKFNHLLLSCFAFLLVVQFTNATATSNNYVINATNSVTTGSGSSQSYLFTTTQQQANISSATYMTIRNWSVNNTNSTNSTTNNTNNTNNTTPTPPTATSSGGGSSGGGGGGSASNAASLIKIHNESTLANDSKSNITTLNETNATTPVITFIRNTSQTTSPITGNVAANNSNMIIGLITLVIVIVIGAFYIKKKH